MAETKHIVNQAIYKDLRTSVEYKLLGLKNKEVILKPEGGDWIAVSYPDFYEYFEDTGIHFHDEACCTVHETHSIPHMGCILR